MHNSDLTCALPLSKGAKRLEWRPLVVKWSVFVRTFRVDQALGEGRFGKVHVAVMRDQVVARPSSSIELGTPGDVVVRLKNSKSTDLPRRCVAVKRLLHPKRDAEHFIRELRVHAYVTAQSVYEGLSHQVVPLLAVLYEKERKQTLRVVASVMPVYGGGTLEQAVDDARRSMSRQRFRVFMQTRWAEGDRILEWLHERCGVVHGDAHLGNWYMDTATNHMVLGDFGEARLRTECRSTKQFLLLAGYERLAFHFEMACDANDKRRLGAKLCMIDERIDLEEDIEGKPLICFHEGS